MACTPMTSVKNAEPNNSNIVTVRKATVGPLSTKIAMSLVSGKGKKVEYMRTGPRISGNPSERRFHREQKEQRPPDACKQDVKRTQTGPSVHQRDAEREKGPPD